MLKASIKRILCYLHTYLVYDIKLSIVTSYNRKNNLKMNSINMIVLCFFQLFTISTILTYIGSTYIIEYLLGTLFMTFGNVRKGRLIFSDIWRYLPISARTQHYCLPISYELYTVYKYICNMSDFP